jgi:serine/threonine protein kinase
VLIDGFDVAPGTYAPGWTPSWSAPEQVLGLEMTEASDIYPLGIMIGHLIGGVLVGEVRKFRTTPARGRTEFDVFYNPVLTRAPSAGPSPKTFAAWADIAARCLRFDSDMRPYTAAELSAAIRRLLQEHPLPGARRIELTGRLVAVTLLDGTSAVARLVDDAPHPRGTAAPPPPDTWHDSTT